MASTNWFSTTLVGGQYMQATYGQWWSIYLQLTNWFSTTLVAWWSIYASNLWSMVDNSYNIILLTLNYNSLIGSAPP